MWLFYSSICVVKFLRGLILDDESAISNIHYYYYHYYYIPMSSRNTCTCTTCGENSVAISMLFVFLAAQCTVCFDFCRYLYVIDVILFYLSEWLIKLGEWVVRMRHPTMMIEWVVVHVILLSEWMTWQLEHDKHGSESTWEYERYISNARTIISLLKDGNTEMFLIFLCDMMIIQDPRRNHRAEKGIITALLYVPELLLWNIKESGINIGEIHVRWITPPIPHADSSQCHSGLLDLKYINITEMTYIYKDYLPKQMCRSPPSHSWVITTPFPFISLDMH